MIAALRVDGSLQAAGATTPVTGVAFVAVQNGHACTLNIGQGFIAVQALLDVVNTMPEVIGIQQRMDPSQGVGAAGRLPQPVLPKAGAGDQCPGVEAAQPSPEQPQRRFHHRGGGDTGLQSPIREWRNDRPGEVEYFFRVGSQAAENG